MGNHTSNHMVPDIPHRELMLLDPEIEIVRVDLPRELTYPIQARGPLPIHRTLGGCNVIQIADSKSGQGSLLQIHSGRFGQALVKILEDITEIPRLIKIYKGLGLSDEVVVNHTTEEVKNREREITFAGQLDHPNITKILAFISPNGTVEKINAIVMEGSYLGTLENYAKKDGRQLPDDVIKSYALQLADALRYCHEEAHLIHRDVRPRNIYVHKNGQIIKLGNFGYAREDDDGSPKTANKGDELYYKAPEMIYAGNVTFYSYPVDVYSYALVIWSVSHLGSKPFWDQNRQLCANSFAFRTYLEASNENRPAIRDDLDPVLKKVIRSCWVNLENRLNKRGTMAEVVAHLKENSRVVPRSKTYQKAAKKTLSFYSADTTKMTVLQRYGDIILVKSFRFGKIRLFPLVDLDLVPDVKHQNIISHYGVLEESDGKMCLMVEHTLGGSLQENLKNRTEVTEDDLALWMLDVSRALYYLLTHKIPYGGVDLDTIYVSGSRAKIEHPLLVNKKSLSPLLDLAIVIEKALALLHDVNKGGKNAEVSEEAKKNLTNLAMDIRHAYDIGIDGSSASLECSKIIILLENKIPSENRNNYEQIVDYA